MRDSKSENCRIGDRLLPGESTQQPEAGYLTLEAVASRTMLPPQTLYNWISTGRIGDEEGVRRIGRRCASTGLIFKKWLDQQ